MHGLWHSQRERESFSFLSTNTMLHNIKHKPVGMAALLGRLKMPLCYTVLLVARQYVCVCMPSLPPSPPPFFHELTNCCFAEEAKRGSWSLSSSYNCHSHLLFLGDGITLPVFGFLGRCFRVIHITARGGVAR